MKKILISVLVLSELAIFSQSVQAPRVCATPILPQQFETWLQSVTPVQGSSKYGSSSVQSVFNIPVIVHVIHNNETVNSISATTGNNLNTAQIQNQINILNIDYNGLNADTSLIPSVFKPLLGKFQVNFCLAVVNPTGGILAEPGIDRINRVTKGWTAPPYTTTYIDATVKPNSIWDPNKYLNIWVCGMSGGILGYATFPNPGTSGLGGLSAPYGTTTSDGVVILNTAFGSIGTASSGVYNKGRTSTHEIGHWMGLRHMWGDGTCATDYCNDTPPAQTSNFNCPSFPYKLGTCTGNTTGEMTMNYMDYTNDACMYMFTRDQKVRSQLIMVNSPMRAALITSTVCNLPTVGTDVGITFVARPTYSEAVNCANFINPVINLTNYGSTVLNSLILTYNVDGVNTQTATWTGTVSPNTSFTVGLAQISGLSAGLHSFSVNVSSPNGGLDNNSSNNNNNQVFTVANILNLSVTSASSCAGAPAVLTASGALTYSWSSGVGSGATVTVNPVVTTVYTVTGSNTVCSVSQTTTVFVTPGPTLVVNSPSVCAGVSATLTASGATNFTWSTGATTSSIVVASLNTANYTVSATNTLACVASKVSTLSILPSPTLTANNQTICSGGTATLTAAGAISYTWSTGANGASILVSPAGNTVYAVTGSNSTCTGSTNVSVTIGSALSMLITKTASVICSGNSVTLTASGANSYTWNTGSNSNSIIVSPLSGTGYTVSGSAGTCPGISSTSIAVNNSPITSITASQVSCFGGSNGQISVSSIGSAPFSYTYSNGPSGLSAGIHTVITGDTKGCLSTNTVLITQPTQLAASIQSGSTTCAASCDGTAGISAIGGVSPYAFVLFPGGSSSGTDLNLCAGPYTYMLTDNNGCQITSQFSVVPGTGVLFVTTTATNVSCSTCANGTLFANSSNGTAPYTYFWQPGGYSTQQVNNVDLGCYGVIVRDAIGCKGVDTVCVTFDTGISNVKGTLAGLTLSPNPNKGEFMVTLRESGNKTVEVYDGLGRRVIALSSMEETIPVNISAVSAGIYYAVIRHESGYAVLKVVIN
ncbi:MAG: M43 family zinc metalloprotease [bacterium]|nr:M43 family zinc metalloprotease [bacterium]